jgi:hypothetical protein
MNKRTNHKYIGGYYRRNSDAVPNPFIEGTDSAATFTPAYSAAMSQRNYFESMSPMKVKASAEDELKMYQS